MDSASLPFIAFLMIIIPSIDSFLNKIIKPWIMSVFNTNLTHRSMPICYIMNVRQPVISNNILNHLLNKYRMLQYYKLHSHLNQSKSCQC